MDVPGPAAREPVGGSPRAEAVFDLLVECLDLPPAQHEERLACAARQDQCLADTVRRRLEILRILGLLELPEKGRGP